MNNISHKNGSTKVFSEKVIGTELGDIFYLQNETSVKVDALIDYDNSNIMCKLNPHNSISMYIPLSQHLKIKENDEPVMDENGIYYVETMSYSVGIVTDKHEEVAEILQEEIDDTGLSAGVFDNAEVTQANAAIGFVIQVLVYGFIALISLITVFNIINTISTGVQMRKKEFAMLKSVGTTPKGFNKMIMLESAFYGIKAIIAALPISVGISYLMYCYARSNVIPFEIDYKLYIAVTTVVFAVVGATMLYSVRKLRNDNIVETLKEEIN